MTTRPEIDASAAELDLRMTEGDLIAFNFLVLDAASWGGATFKADVKESQDVDAPIVISLAVVVTVETANLDVKLNHAATPLLVKSTRYYWDMQEQGGMTRFSGQLHVMPQVTDA